MILAALALAAAPHAATVRHRHHHATPAVRMVATAQRRLAPPCSGPACRTPSPYRLASDSDAGPDMKARALADTGTRCALIGETICQSKTHAILRSGETPLETIGSNLPQ